MTALAYEASAYRAPFCVRVRFRRLLDGDQSFILDSWSKSWRLQRGNVRLPGPDYARRFRALVTDGVLAQRDTEFVVACSVEDPGEIYGWLCYTPGVVPTVHFAVVRKHPTPTLPVSPRRLGLLSRMVAAAGVRSSLVYTFRPAERAHKDRRDNLGVENGLLAAARRAGINAVFRRVDEFLAHRSGR